MTVGKTSISASNDSIRNLGAHFTPQMDMEKHVNTVLNKLQRVQNTAARIITKTPRHDHITPVLKELHWLPICQRIDYKVLLYTYKALHGQCPQYTIDLLCVYRPARDLRSSNSLTLVIPRTRTVTFGRRSFSHAAPRLWNALPESVRNAKTLNACKRQLKTHLFRSYYVE
ncbi:uncharacterized protein LOC134247212 [Saccostrea cucullata]|uniref:uncharacterized protein LOC134247212 n=1 Tax=Saccostrea cuccullata TaxID=36930 RepID=UPI002ED2B9DD